MDISTITDLKELRALRGDEFMKREQANQQVQVAEQNINFINQRITELETKKKPEDKSDKK